MIRKLDHPHFMWQFSIPSGGPIPDRTQFGPEPDALGNFKGMGHALLSGPGGVSWRLRPHTADVLRWRVAAEVRQHGRVLWCAPDSYAFETIVRQSIGYGGDGGCFIGYARDGGLALAERDSAEASLFYRNRKTLKARYDLTYAIDVFVRACGKMQGDFVAIAKVAQVEVDFTLDVLDEEEQGNVGSDEDEDEDEFVDEEEAEKFRQAVSAVMTAGKTLADALLDYKEAEDAGCTYGDERGYVDAGTFPFPEPDADATLQLGLSAALAWSQGVLPSMRTALTVLRLVLKTLRAIVKEAKAKLGRAKQSTPAYKVKYDELTKRASRVQRLVAALTELMRCVRDAAKSATSAVKEATDLLDRVGRMRIVRAGEWYPCETDEEFGYVPMTTPAGEEPRATFTETYVDAPGYGDVVVCSESDNVCWIVNGDESVGMVPLPDRTISVNDANSWWAYKPLRRFHGTDQGTLGGEERPG